jgi:hypothetical protein
MDIYHNSNACQYTPIPQYSPLSALRCETATIFAKLARFSSLHSKDKRLLSKTRCGLHFFILNDFCLIAAGKERICCHVHPDSDYNAGSSVAHHVLQLLRNPEGGAAWSISD